MLLADLRIGDKVMIVAKGDFYAYVDGWHGTVTGFQMGGAVWLKGPGMIEPGLQGGADTQHIELLVPPDQLAHTV